MNRRVMTVKMMLRIFSIVLLLFAILLSSCKTRSGTDSNQDTEGQNMSQSIPFTSSMSPEMTQIGHVVYFIEQNEDIWQLIYADLDSEISGPLCGKAECAHNDASCDSFLGDMGIGDLCTDGSWIYWVCYCPEDNVTHLWRMDPDGKNHEDVMKLADSERNDLFPSDSPFVSISNQLLVIAGGNTTVTAGQVLTNAQVTLYSLESKYGTVIFDTGYSNQFVQIIAIIHQGHIYYALTNTPVFTKEDEEQNSRIEFYNYDLETKKNELIYVESFDRYFSLREFVIKENEIYYLLDDIQMQGGLYCLNVKSGRSEKRYDVYGAHHLTVDKEIDLIREGENAFRILVREFDGKTVSESVYPWEDFSACVMMYMGANRTDAFYMFQNLETEDTYHVQIPLTKAGLRILWEGGDLLMR